MRYLIYKLTNTVTGHIYIGAHATEDPNDDYKGSGTRLRRAQRKYGKDAFTKEVLCECADEQAMYAKEAELVNEEFVARPDTYNLRIGGLGGWSHIDYDARSKDPVYLHKLSASTVSTSVKKLWADPEWRAKVIAAQTAGKLSKPSYRASHGGRNKGQPAHPATLAALQAGRDRYWAEQRAK
jgi:hypothetical protein